MLYIRSGSQFQEFMRVSTATKHQIRVCLTHLCPYHNLFSIAFFILVPVFEGLIGGAEVVTIGAEAAEIVAVGAEIIDAKVMTPVGVNPAAVGAESAATSV